MNSSVFVLRRAAYDGRHTPVLAFPVEVQYQDALRKMN